MTKKSFILIFLILAVSLHSCKKTDLPINLDHPQNIDNRNSNVELLDPSEEIINGELFIDGISQKEVVTDFNIEGVRVIDGRLAFKDHDALLQGLFKISEYNTESVIAWSKKIGFNSLFTELTRIEEKSEDEIRIELSRGMYNKYFHLSDNGLQLSKHSPVHARFYDTQGLIQVGEFVGTISNGLNVWVKSDKVNKLVDALQSGRIAQKDKDFFIIDDRAFDSDYKNWVALEDCPKSGYWLGPNNQYKNPNDNRRIEVQNLYDALITPLNNGNVNTDFTYWVFTISKKASWNKYKTNHYLSIDIRSQLFLNGFPSGSVAVRQNTDTGNTNTKYGDIFNYFGGFRDISLSAAFSNFQRLEETIPGSSGMTGTAGSHRGMGGLYGRQDCD